MLLTSSSSKTIIRENFVRYWPVPVLTLIAYILAGIAPVMLNYREFNSISAYSARFVSATGFALNFILAVSCVIASAAVFSYLHDPVSATAMHAMPAGRKKLFASAAVSGWMFIMIPVLIVAFLMLTMRGASVEPGFDPATSYEMTSLESYVGTAKEIFTFSHSMAFIFNTFVTGTFTYAVCCLSAVLSGKKTIHVLLAMFLIALPTVLFAQIESIFNMFLYGFTSLSFPYSWLSAISWSLGRDGFGIEPGFSAFYLALAAVLLVGSYYIYKAVRLERIGNASTFPLVADALCVVLTFIGGLGLAEIIISLAAPAGSNSLRFIAASIAASVFVYIIMRMIADSTPAVFNFTTLKKSLVYFAIMAVFLAFAVGDITHYQTRVPEVSEVESVTYTANVPEEAIGTHEYTDKGMIEAVRNLQTALIETKDVDYRNVDTEYDTEIEWHLKNGKTIRRFYDERFGNGFEKVEKAAADIYDQKSFRDNILASVDYLAPHLKGVRVYGNDDYDGETGEQIMTYISKEDWPGLTDAVKKDYAARTFDQSRTEDWAFIIEFVSDATEDANGGYYPEGLLRGFTMNAGDENTINYLTEKGYYEKMRITN